MTEQVPYKSKKRMRGRYYERHFQAMVRAIEELPLENVIYFPRIKPGLDRQFIYDVEFTLKGQRFLLLFTLNYGGNWGGPVNDELEASKRATAAALSLPLLEFDRRHYDSTYYRLAIAAFVSEYLLKKGIRSGLL